MPYASIQGQEIHFEDTGGTGPAMVLAHGFLMDTDMFAPQVAAFAPPFRIVRWDARGFGQTRSDGRPFTYWDSARDCLGLMDHLGIERAILGGMSQGGFASLRAALLAPERVRALLLFSTQAGVENPAIGAGYRQMMETWLAHGPVPPLAEAIAHILLGDRAFFEPWITKWHALPREGLPPAMECLMDRDDITTRLGEIQAPAIVFHGTADTAIPMERAEALASGLPACEGLVKVEGAAHATNLTHPAGVHPHLSKFLAKFA